MNQGACFDLAETLESGQVFHWTRARSPGALPLYVGVIGDRAVWVRQSAEGAPRIAASPGDDELAAEYFGLRDAMDEIFASFPADDPVLAEAVAYCPGLRIIRQPAWECLATFITSSLKQVAQIRKISLHLRERFGEPLGNLLGHELYAYPSPAALADAGEAALRECGMGYRAKALHRAAQRFASGQDSVDEMQGLSDEALREQLCDFYGVGEKIANCVMLFGFGRFGAFPIDVWIARVMREHYWRRLRGKTAPLPRVQDFAERHFGPNRGYAQQFFYHWARHVPGAQKSGGKEVH